VEVVRRAAYAWVLYRDDSRPALRSLAADACIWLFQEEPGHVLWEERRDCGELGMSFLGICESLGLDPDVVRRGIRSLTPQRIKTLGRIPTNRAHKGGADSMFSEEAPMVADLPEELREVLMEEEADMGDDTGEVLYGGIALMEEW